MGTDAPDPSNDPKSAFVQKIAREAGITEAQVHDLISMVGYDYPSLVREARMLNKSRGR
jgi:hypothetical protein